MGPIGVLLKQSPHILADAGVFPGRFLVRSREKVEATVVPRYVVKGDPDADRLLRGEGPVRVVEMPAGRIGPGLFNQRLVVPDADAIDAGQFSGHPAQPDIDHQFPYAVMIHPQIKSLGKDFIIV